MASYLLHFTKGLVPVPGQMPRLARDLVRRGLYGIPSTATQRHKIRRGELVVVTVGSPHRVFVADAVVESFNYMSKGPETAGDFDTWDHLEKIDDLTVRVVTKVPDASAAGRPSAASSVDQT